MQRTALLVVGYGVPLRLIVAVAAENAGFKIAAFISRGLYVPMFFNSEEHNIVIVDESAGSLECEAIAAATTVRETNPTTPVIYLKLSSSFVPSGFDGICVQKNDLGTYVTPDGHILPVSWMKNLTEILRALPPA